MSDADTAPFHGVLTRFSYQNVPGGDGNRSIPPWQLTEDLLSPRRLDFRLAVFEMTCAASLLGQTQQDFEWILIIDRRLPERYRIKIERLLVGRRRTHLYEYQPGEDLGNVGWLRRYIVQGCSHLLTTQLDDDDALPRNFIEVLQRRVRRQAASLPIQVAASTRSDQWELLSSARAPLGYRCAWHRGDWITSAGLSLLSPVSPDCLTVLSLNHLLADIWTSPARGAGLQRLLLEKWGEAARRPETTRFIAARLDEFQQRVRRLSGASSLPEDGGFIDLTAEVGAVVVGNHFLNDQYLRLLERKSGRSRAQGPESFPNVTLRFDRFRERSCLFRKCWSNYWRLLRISCTRSGRWRQRARMLIWASWRFLRA